MNGCMPIRVMRNPCARPISTPSASIRIATTGQNMPSATSETKSTPRSAITEPTESSMPPVMITKPCPIANRPKRPTRFAVLARLIGDRKRGLISATMVPTTRISTRRPRSFFCMPQLPPTASSSTRSSENSGRSRVPAIRPSCITAMRSLTPITSSMSLDIISTATPASASPRRMS